MFKIPAIVWHCKNPLLHSLTWMFFFWYKFFFSLVCFQIIVSYLLLASGAAVKVLTSSTAELKTLMFSEEYSPAGLLYWLVTTLEPNPEKGRALLLWLEPMLFTSYWEKTERKKKAVAAFLWGAEQKCWTRAFVKSCWLRHAAAHSANWTPILLLLLMCRNLSFIFQLSFHMFGHAAEIMSITNVTQHKEKKKKSLPGCVTT